jgi:hypothetical protein
LTSAKNQLSISKQGNMAREKREREVCNNQIVQGTFKWLVDFKQESDVIYALGNHVTC